MFIDKAKIFIKSGSGGHGCISFRREKYIPFGGPHGGNGGKGGDVYFVGSRDLNTLFFFKCNKHFFAQTGERGGTYQKAGKNGEDLYIKAPLGTIINNNGEIIEILDETPVLIAKGGRGGVGNASLKTSTDRLPRRSIPPEPGIELELSLSLKIIGDIGIIGKPNAGKSSLINTITNCNSKVCNYAFTTLSPCMGVYKDIIFVDLPGIIEGASEGKGLGLQFLAHLERCKAYIQLIDISDDPIENYYQVQKEIKAYGIDKPHLVVLNKSELLKKEQVMQIVKDFKDLNVNAIYISAQYKSGINNLLKQVNKLNV